MAPTTERTIPLPDGSELTVTNTLDEETLAVTSTTAVRNAVPASRNQSGTAPVDGSQLRRDPDGVYRLYNVAVAPEDIAALVAESTQASAEAAQEQLSMFRTGITATRAKAPVFTKGSGRK